MINPARLWRFAPILLGLSGPHAAFAGSISIVNEVFADSNTVISVACYNGGGSQGPNGLNCSPAGFVWDHAPNATVSGTSDTTGAATNASENLTLGSPSGESAQAFAQGSLATGSVGILSSGSSGAEGVTSVSLNDMIHFSVAGAGPSTVTPIQISWTFDGLLSGPFLGFSGAPVQAASILSLGGTVSASEDIFGGPPQLTAVNQSGWVTENFSSETASLVQFTGVYDLVGSSVTLPISLSLTSFASNGDMADFSHTSQVGLILPKGVTFTSDSGAFLAGAPAVPEPSSAVPLGLALIGIGIYTRRKTAAE